jgi:phage/plasmid-like protein (TIGR03299 family)
MLDLQTNTLIGMTDQRGNAWHKRDDLRRLPDGTTLEDNHYPGFIPVEDVNRRLFHWQPVKAPVAYLVPCGPDEADFITKAGVAVKVVESDAGRHGLLRSDNLYDLGTFKTAQHQPYNVGLIEEAERLTGSILGVSSAGVLAKGGRAWVEFSLPETHHDSKSGFSYRANLVKADSLDGTMAKTTFRSINATVCDNTLSWNTLEAKKAGMLFRRKHTANFGDLQDERDALGIIEQIDVEFTSELHAMIEREVTKKQVIQVLDVIMPVPEVKEGREFTRRMNRRDEWMSLYETSPMCAPWQGTAFGVFQTDNTFRHWFKQVNGEQSRAERNTYVALKGWQAKEDQKLIAALESVLV